MHIPQMVESVECLYRVTLDRGLVDDLVGRADDQTRQSFRVKGCYQIGEQGYDPSSISTDQLMLDAYRIGLDVDDVGDEAEVRYLVQEHLNDRFAFYFTHRLYDAVRELGG